MKKTSLSIALSLVLGVASVASHATTVNAGDTLTINAGVPHSISSGIITSFTGSYFGLDSNFDGMIEQTEKIAVSQGTTGLVIGTSTAPGAIDAPWSLLGVNGSDYLTVAATGSTTSGLNLSGWTISWNNVTIPLGTGAWQPINCSDLGCSGHTFTNGNAEFSWDGIYGDTYSLNYAATVPAGNISGFGGYSYYLHLEGVVKPVPLPAASLLLGSGLLGLMGVARRKRTNKT